MAHVLATVTVFARRKVTIDFLVDTGATFAIIPPSLARRVGAPMLPRPISITLADGRRRRVRACTVEVSVAGRRGPATALVLRGAGPLLGVETLEGLGLKVNPTTERLGPSRSRGALAVGTRLALARR